MDDKELCKLRIEDYGRERHSLRDMEWRVFFETFTGYAALAVCFAKVHDHMPRSKTVLVIGIVASLLLCGFGCFLLGEIHLRMRSAADLKRAYFARLHELTGLNIEKEPDRLRWWWATYPQLAMLYFVAVAFIVWIFYSTYKY